MAGVSETRTYDSLLTTTLANYSGQLADNVFDEYPHLSWYAGKLAGAKKAGKNKRVLDGGETIVEHILYEQSTSVTKYRGYQNLNLIPQEGMTIARYDWRQIAVAITISGLERRSNMGEAKMLDLWKGKIKQAEMSLRDQLSRDFFGSNGDGASIDGLGIIVDSTGACGGLNASSFSVWAATETASGSFAAQGLKDMRTLFNTLSYGNNTPDGLFTTQAIFEFYETALQPQERYVDTDSANSGFANLKFKNIPLFFDRDCTSGVIFMLNSRNIKWNVHRDADFATTAAVTPNDQDATTALILVQGNLTTDERRKHGKLTGITA